MNKTIHSIKILVCSLIASSSLAAGDYHLTPGTYLNLTNGSRVFCDQGSPTPPPPQTPKCIISFNENTSWPSDSSYSVMTSTGRSLYDKKVGVGGSIVDVANVVEANIRSGNCLSAFTSSHCSVSLVGKNCVVTINNNETYHERNGVGHCNPEERAIDTLRYYGYCY